MTTIQHPQLRFQYEMIKGFFGEDKVEGILREWVKERDSKTILCGVCKTEDIAKVLTRSLHFDDDGYSAIFITPACKEHYIEIAAGLQKVRDYYASD